MASAAKIVTIALLAGGYALGSVAWKRYAIEQVALQETALKQAERKALCVASAPQVMRLLHGSRAEGYKKDDFLKFAKGIQSREPEAKLTDFQIGLVGDLIDRHTMFDAVAVPSAAGSSPLRAGESLDYSAFDAAVKPLYEQLCQSK